jgi:hypothetical protein
LRPASIVASSGATSGPNPCLALSKIHCGREHESARSTRHDKLRSFNGIVTRSAALHDSVEDHGTKLFR